MNDEHSSTVSGHADRPAALPAEGTGEMVCVLCAATYPAAVRYCQVDGSPLRPANYAEDDLLGKVIDDRYHMVAKLGEGGMGNVYLGEHVRTRRRCAVKVISRTYAADPEALRRFLREATNAGRINHPHVATLYDFGEAGDGLAYLAMEYVEGESLSALLAREGALPAARAVDIARQVAEGVGFAHELGIVHRDLKPGNILLSRDRHGADLVKVVDFGIARAPAEEEQNLTRTGMVIGTPEYMSPEQLIGDPVDGRSDIYSLGCILYQMLTGEQPFSGPTAQVIARRLTEQPPHPREKNPAISKPLDDVIYMSLARLPADRYQTMEALREGLAAPEVKPAPPATRRLADWFGRFSRPRTQDEPTTGAAEVVPEPPRTDGSISWPVTPREATLLTPPSGPRTAAPTEAVDEVPADEPEQVPAPDATEPAVSDTGPHDTQLLELDAEPGDVVPVTRSRMVKRSVIGAAAAVLLLLAGFGLFRDRTPEPADLPPLVVSPAPPPAPDQEVVSALWREVWESAIQADSDQWIPARTRLRAVQDQATTLLASFPGDIGLLNVLESARRQDSVTAALCQSIREVELGRPGGSAPVCDLEPAPQINTAQ